MELLKVQSHETLRRDPITGAILDVDASAAESFRRQRDIPIRLSDLENRLVLLEQSLIVFDAKLDWIIAKLKE